MPEGGELPSDEELEAMVAAERGDDAPAAEAPHDEAPATVEAAEASASAPAPDPAVAEAETPSTETA